MKHEDSLRLFTCLNRIGDALIDNNALVKQIHYKWDANLEVSLRGLEIQEEHIQIARNNVEYQVIFGKIFSILDNREEISAEERLKQIRVIFNMEEK
jgi:hypothetical protein